MQKSARFFRIKAICQDIAQAWSAFSVTGFKARIEPACQNARHLMASQKSSVIQRNIRHRRHAGQVFWKGAECCLIISAASCNSQRNRSRLCPTARAPGPLLIIRDARRDVPTNHGFQIAEINTHFHSCRTAEEVEFAFPKSTFNHVPQAWADRSSMFTRDCCGRECLIALDVVILSVGIVTIHAFGGSSAPERKAHSGNVKSSHTTTFFALETVASLFNLQSI